MSWDKCPQGGDTALAADMSNLPRRFTASLSNCRRSSRFPVNAAFAGAAAPRNRTRPPPATPRHASRPRQPPYQVATASNSQRRRLQPTSTPPPARGRRRRLHTDGAASRGGGRHLPHLPRPPGERGPREPPGARPPPPPPARLRPGRRGGRSRPGRTARRAALPHVPGLRTASRAPALSLAPGWPVATHSMRRALQPRRRRLGTSAVRRWPAWARCRPLLGAACGKPSALLPPPTFQPAPRTSCWQASWRSWVLPHPLHPRCPLPPPLHFRCLLLPRSALLRCLASQPPKPCCACCA